MLKKSGGNGVEVPHELLSADTLNSMIEEFVLREGTDYGHQEHPLDRKITQVRRQIESGEIVILYDEASESFDLVKR